MFFNLGFVIVVLDIIGV